MFVLEIGKWRTIWKKTFVEKPERIWCTGDRRRLEEEDRSWFVKRGIWFAKCEIDLCKVEYDLLKIENCS